MKHKQLFGGLFENKTVLITGHTGFKGAWLSLWLNELGANVVGYSLEPPTQPNLFEQCALGSKVRSILGDVRDRDQLQKVIGEIHPEIIFHLAAQPLVRHSYANPLETIITNVLGTVHVLEAIRLNGTSVRVCQIITSDKCYENEENGRAYSETDKLGGHDPYSASKACAEVLTAAYRNSFFQPSANQKLKISISSVRAGNVIGGGDWGKDRLIPDCIRALSQNEPISIRNPESTRPWQFILDVLLGYLRLAEQQWNDPYLYAGAWNFGSSDIQNLTVGDIAQKIIQEWGRGSWQVQKKSGNSGQSEPHEAQFLKLDSSKAQKLLGWHHVYALNESIHETVRWYRDTAALEPDLTHAYTIKQIEQYVNSAQKQNYPWTQQKKILYQ